LKTRRPTRRLGTSNYRYILTQKGLVCKMLTFATRRPLLIRAAPLG